MSRKIALYQFNEIYYRLTGEYENSVQILFFKADGKDLLVYNAGFDLVNKPAQLNLSGFTRLFNDNEDTYRILRLAYKIAPVEDDLLDETYIELDNAVIHIAWQFSTVSGQLVKGFQLYHRDQNKVKCDELIKAMESAREEEIADLRFI